MNCYGNGKTVLLHCEFCMNFPIPYNLEEINMSGIEGISLEKIKFDLSSDSKNLRKNCLDELKLMINSDNCTFEHFSNISVLGLIVETFADEAETCRQRAVNLAILYVNSCQIHNEDVLLQLLSTVHRRVVTAEERESCEEIRLLYVDLLKNVILKQKLSISPYLKEIVECLVYFTSDQCPEVKKKSCECISELAKAVPEFRLHSDNITNAMIKILKHKHYKVRVAVINSLCHVVQFGRPGNIELVYGPLGECLLDQHPQVRLAVLKCGAFWLCNLRDRHSYFYCLLPLILTELSDEVQEIREKASKLWNEIGLTYLKENEEHLKEKLDFLPAQLQHYPPNVLRPNLGCRTLVQNELIKIIPTLLKELEDWKVEVRVKSSDLLKAIVLHAEEYVISFMEKLIPSLCKACTDEEVTIRNKIIDVAEIIGYFVSPEIYWPLIIPQIKENQTAASYIILSSFLNSNLRTDVSAKINDIISDLSNRDICETREESSQTYLLTAISKVLDCCNETNLYSDVTENLYLILLTVMAFGNAEVKRNAAGLIERLSHVAGYSCVSDLNRKYLSKVLNQISATCDMWESYSANFNIFIILLTQYADDVFELVPEELLKILEFVLSSENDREMIFKTLYSIAELFESILPIQKNFDMMEKIIIGPVKQQLVWKAGKVAEVVRATALSIVLFYLQNSENITPNFFSNIFPFLLSLCEDSYEESRLYSLQSMSYINQYQTKNVPVYEVFPKLLYVVADRFNDKSRKVRIMAAKTIKDLLLVGPELHAYKNESDFQKISHAMKMLLINMDDDDTKIQKACSEIIEEPVVVDKLKTVLSEKELDIFIKKCHNKDVSVLMKMHLKI